MGKSQGYATASKVITLFHKNFLPSKRHVQKKNPVRLVEECEGYKSILQQGGVEDNIWTFKAETETI